MTAAVATGVGLVGGGRWARVIASVLDEMVTGVPIAATSPTYPGAWDHVAGRPGWRVAASLAEVMEDPALSHVVIARRAHDHAPTVLAALRAGKAVLVEKPFCLTRAEGEAILAAIGERPCLTGLVLAHARNQQLFLGACLARGPVVTLRLVWSDAEEEARHGEAKRHDASLNVLQDVLPHGWSLLRPFLQGALVATGVGIVGGGQEVTLHLSATNATARLTLSRGHSRRERVLEVEGADYRATLDFTQEPGTARIDGLPFDVATGFSSPLAAQLRAFLHGQPLPLTRLSAATEALDLTLAAMPDIRRQQRKAIRSTLPSGPDALFALAEVAAGGTGFDGRPSSVQDIARWADCPETKIAAALAALPTGSFVDTTVTKKNRAAFEAGEDFHGGS